MASVDDRIVAMKFDNAAFQDKVASTIASLDKLKGSLDFANANRGMNDLTLASKNFSLQGISDAVEGISGKFSAMGAVAFSVINNVVDRAISAGVQLAKSLSLNQIIGGFQEYETNLNSIQTILANTQSKGSQLKDVNAALDELNTYSDKTIYNFSQMARNIGTFTAAGVDLDTSTQAIKGIANLAAVSGSNADQASTAMYQLSQALASGSVKLMDWNSVVNAGMGGEVFKNALFETAKTLGTIKDVPIDETLKQWTDAGNNFRDSLQDGWITADVLTTTLSGFTGDMTDAQLAAQGFSAQQIQQIQQMGKTAQDAATKVKTMTQLLDTVKESIGSGWSTTFRTIFGDFEQARNSFTELNDIIGGFVKTSADNRNALLSDWAALGGRTALFDGIKAAIQGVVNVMAPIKAAFHDVFPPATGHSLVNMTIRFKELMEAITPSPAVAVQMTRIFRGLFSAFHIGIEVVKGIVGFFKDLINVFDNRAVSHNFLAFAANIADFFTRINDKLKDGEALTNFFSDLAVAIGQFVRKSVAYMQPFIDKVGEIKDTITGFFKGGGDDSSAASDVMSGVLGRLSERFGFLGTIVKGLWKAFQYLIDKFPNFTNALSGIGNFIKNHFSGIPQKIADAFANTNYDQALDTVNTGLFGGLVLLVKKFLSGGFDFGGGLMKNVSKSLDTLTGTLKAMQTDIKAEALLKIAGALAILTVSLVVLSLMDSGALTRAFVAMGIGFAQLATAMGLLNQVVSGPTDALKLGILSLALLGFAASMLVFGAAMKIFATMSWEEIGKGVAAVSSLLVALSIAVKPMSDNSGGMIRAGISMIAIAVALNILALAVKSFAEMEWESMAQGLTGVAGGLIAVVGAMNLMPSGSLLKGLGLLEVAVALNILALAVKSFAEMEWADMAKGMAGVAGGLLIIAGAMNLMPLSLPITAAGLLLVGIALNEIADAMQSIGGMSWKAIGKGLVGIAGALTVLAIAGAVMETSIGGALAIIVMSHALKALGDAVIVFAGISWSDLLHGIGAMAIALGALALTAVLLSPAIGALFALGAALLVVGAGMALFGLGANLVATAFSIIATAGTEGIATLASALDLLITHLPAIIAALADGLIQLGEKILEAAPGLITKLDTAIQALIQLVINNIPGIVTAGVTFISSMLDAIVTLFPKFVETGYQLIVQLLQGISDHIVEITDKAIEIMGKFLTEIGNHAQELAGKGLEILTNLLKGIADHIGDVVGTVGLIISKFVTEVGASASKIVTAGADALVQFLNGISDNIYKVAHAATDVVTRFLSTLSENIIAIANAGLDFIINVMNGISAAIDSHTDDLRNAGLKLAGAVINGMTLGLAGKAKDAVSGAIGGIAGGAVDTVKKIWGVFSPSRVFREMAENVIQGLVLGLDNSSGAETSAAYAASRITDAFQASLNAATLALNTSPEFNPTITPILDLSNVQTKAKTLNAMLASTIPFTPAVSTDQAKAIFAETVTSRESTPADVTAQNTLAEVTYNQYNYSPEALSSADIFRQTHNLIALKKEELATV